MLQNGALLVFVLVICLIPVAVCQSALSANSGINSADTYVIADLTITNNANITLPGPVYNPVTGTSSSTLTVGPLTLTFHVEAGYDSTGVLVMNLWPTTAPVDPINSDGNALGFIRFAGGQMTAFDQSGNPLPIPSFQGIPTNWPARLLGSNPGPSVLSNLVFPDVRSYASARSAALSYGSPASTAYVTLPQTQSGNAEWTFAQSGSNWVAQQVVITPAISNGTSTRTVQFANVSWYDNAANDSVRASKAYTGQQPPTSYGSIPTVTTGAPSGSTTVFQLGGPQNVAFMHGFLSSGITWFRMEGWLNQDFRFGAEVTPSYTSTNSLSSQGTSLIGEINSVGGNNYILIGHSQGGLISRYAAQYFQSNPPNKVRGVVTLDTPHKGVALVQNGPVIGPAFALLGALLWDWTGCYTQWDNAVCLLAWLAFNIGPPFGAVFTVVGASPDVVDFTPGSGFLTSLNAYQETFAQAAVVGNTPQRWNESRIAWDFLAPYIFPPYTCDPNYYPESGCGEDAVATIVGATYDYVEALLAISIFDEIFCPDRDYLCNVDLILQLSAILAGMDGIDWFWNLAVSGFGASDAIVQSSSQNYPYSSAVQYPINGSHSHLENTHSPYDHTTLDQVLESSAFNVPTQASCTFTPTPTTYSVSGNGGTTSFSLATGAGCQWSAVSREPWLSITSGTSGTAGGTIGLSVAANPVTLPRTGAIQAGNGLTNTSFTVFQGGACTYSLSSNLIVLQPGGGTATVSVTTETGCVWSAVSGATWLTITSGAGGTASGTGSGSFTFTASPGNQDASFSGIITVMGQTLTVIVGSAVGTPGTGTVTIQGSPQSATVNLCHQPLAPCYFTYYESGTAAVTVAGRTFTAYYVENTTASQIAQSLSSSMNATGSPISATASGSVISIKSVVNGADTDYSLSTSYTFGSTEYFSSPAFTGVPSGSQLVGGTD